MSPMFSEEDYKLIPFEPSNELEIALFHSVARIWDSYRATCFKSSYFLLLTEGFETISFFQIKLV